MEETKWVEIAKIGTWQAMNGENVQITKDKLDTIISSFDEEDRRVPLVFGHPKTDHPAYGWVSVLRRVNDVLQAKFKQVHADVTKLVDDGHFKNVSISLNRKLELRHVGLLGATQPAIPGLKEVSFATEDNAWCISFGQHEASSRVVELEEKLREAEEALAAAKQGESHELASHKRQDRLQKLIDNAHVLPCEREAILCFADSLSSSDNTFQFASSDTPVPAEEAFWQFLETRQQHGLFETITPDKKPEKFTQELGDLVDII